MSISVVRLIGKIIAWCNYFSSGTDGKVVVTWCSISVVVTWCSISVMGLMAHIELNHMPSRNQAL